MDTFEQILNIKNMKKLLMIALVLNLVSCSNDTDETSSTQVAETKPSSFNPNPTPEDYRKANYPNFMSDLLNYGACN